ncbi:hypothetical protein EV182_001385, partial [Spiromyces aspiralis]
YTKRNQPTNQLTKMSSNGNIPYFRSPQEAMEYMQGMSMQTGRDVRLLLVDESGRMVGSGNDQIFGSADEAIRAAQMHGGPNAEIQFVNISTGGRHNGGSGGSGRRQPQNYNPREGFYDGNGRSFRYNDGNNSFQFD